MNSEQQRLAIAEACGWHTIAFDKGWIKAGDGETQAIIPDYINDLNAMHEAKLTLSPKDLSTMMCILIQMGVDRNFNFFVATAEQQAEAFLRTIRQ